MNRTDPAMAETASNATSLPSSGDVSSALRLSDKQRFDWLQLIRSANVGPATFYQLLAHYGSARKAILALPDLARKGGSKRKIQIASEADIAEEWQQLHQAGARLVALGEKDYPQDLTQIHAPPPLLTIMGNCAWAQRQTIAIVGSRNCSAAGRKLTGQIAADLGEAGVTIASGLARGIDTAAHKASLETGTIAVVAGGLNRIYPPENIDLAHAIAQQGLLISEMPWNWQARSQDFPRRNRIISGLSAGTLIVEAAKRSGSLITARYALEQDRDVFAIPGSPLDPRADGGNHLIQQGACLVCDANDILSALTNRLPHDPAPLPLGFKEPADNKACAEDQEEDALSPDQRDRFVSSLSPTPISVDELLRQSDLTASQIQMLLLELDIAGRLERHGNQMVSLLG
nr:DNA-processing protein DprA [Cohaesibacter intestini]